MATPNDRLLQWLRDAHAAEEQAKSMLSRMVGRLEQYPQLQARIEQHIDETQQQAERLRGCIERLGSSTSTFKDMSASILGMGQAMSGLFVSDEVVKGALAGYAFEHMEIASYRILIAAAEVVGDAETKRVCEQNLAEEEAMADWLRDNLDDITRSYLQLQADPGASAKS